MNVNGQEPAKQTPQITWGQKIGRPIMWMGIGFITCKVLEAYTEKKKAKRLTQ